MGKNYKEIAAYHYLHGTDKKIPPDMLRRLFNTWNRANYDWPEYRMRRIMILKRQLDRELKNELEDIGL